nr:hypothetical protein [Tanacetum cinerariifolium]
MQKLSWSFWLFIMVVLVVLLAAVGEALFNAGVAHFNVEGKHLKRCVRLMNACNLASCNRSCEDADGGICISKVVCCETSKDAGGALFKFFVEKLGMMSRET